MATANPGGPALRPGWWKRFGGNTPALAAGAYLCLCLLVALTCYTLAPDSTRHANLQVLEFAKKPPGFQAKWLKVPLPGFEPGAAQPVFSWGGQAPTYRPIALADTAALSLRGNFLRYVRYNGIADSLEWKKRMTGEPAPTMEAITQQWVHTHTYWLGSDNYGRDLLSRVLVGTRISIAVGLLSVLLSLLIGITLGMAAGYFGGWWDAGILWLISVVWSLPTLLLALAISFVLGKGFWQVFVAIGLSTWVEVARIVRGQVLSLRQQPFIEATRALGFRFPRVIIQHLLPNLISPVIVISIANFGAAVLIESGLSFLGIGVEVPIPSWGRMIYEGYTYIVFENGKWLAFFPGLALILLVVAINLVGIGLRDALDVKLDT